MYCNARCSPSTTRLIPRRSRPGSAVFDKPFDDLVLTTGEGLRRLLKVARRIIPAGFHRRGRKARKFARGPKPGRALREIGLEPQMTTKKPTIEGIAEMLFAASTSKDIAWACSFIRTGITAIDRRNYRPRRRSRSVLPYIYDAQAARPISSRDRRDGAGPHRRGRADEFGQVRRLIEAPRRINAKRGCARGWRARRSPRSGRWSQTNSKSHGLRTDIAPANDAYFMKPLISAMATALGKKQNESCRRISNTVDRAGQRQILNSPGRKLQPEICRAAATL